MLEYVSSDFLSNQKDGALEFLFICWLIHFEFYLFACLIFYLSTRRTRPGVADEQEGITLPKPHTSASPGKLYSLLESKAFPIQGGGRFDKPKTHSN